MIDAGGATDRRGVRQGVVAGTHPPQVELRDRGAVVAVKQLNTNAAALGRPDCGSIGANFRVE